MYDASQGHVWGCSHLGATCIFVHTHTHTHTFVHVGLYTKWRHFLGHLHRNALYLQYTTSTCTIDKGHAPQFLWKQHSCIVFMYIVRTCTYVHIYTYTCPRESTLKLPDELM